MRGVFFVCRQTLIKFELGNKCIWTCVSKVLAKENYLLLTEPAVSVGIIAK